MPESVTRAAVPRIAVIIPSYNRPRRLQACLEALCRDFPPDAEVIVVSDGGDRTLFPDLGRFETALRLKVIHAPHGGQALARNIGLEQTSAQVVAFTDDDCLPEPGWVSAIAAGTRLEPPVATAGFTYNGLPDNLYAASYQLILDIAERDHQQKDYHACFYPSNNLAFPAAALRGIGGFDPAFRAAEDREICRRWLRAGYGLGKAPGARMAHAPDLTLSSYWRKFISHGEAAAQFYAAMDEAGEGLSVAFHLRAPWHALALIRQQNLRRPIRLIALLAVWEMANLVGYLRYTFGKREPAVARPVSPDGKS